MLQIATGRFFGGRPVHEEDCEGLLYGSIDAFIPIRTPLGRCAPLIGADAPQAYVVHYKNRMEAGGVLIRIGDLEIIEQTAAILTFTLPGFFDRDRDLVQRVSRAPRGINDESPANYLPRKLGTAPGRNNAQLIPAAEAFIARMVKLPRDDFTRIIRAIKSL